MLSSDVDVSVVTCKHEELFCCSTTVEYETFGEKGLRTFAFLFMRSTLSTSGPVVLSARAVFVRPRKSRALGYVSRTREGEMLKSEQTSINTFKKK